LLEIEARWAHFIWLDIGTLALHFGVEGAPRLALVVQPALHDPCTGKLHDEQPTDRIGTTAA